MRWLAPKREKRAWKAECSESCPLGLGKGSWKRADDQSTGTGTVRFNHSRQPFWKRSNAPASYFMKRRLARGEGRSTERLNGLGSPFGIETYHIVTFVCGL